VRAADAVHQRADAEHEEQPEEREHHRQQDGVDARARFDARAG
jgi:hypothetical protein